MPKSKSFGYVPRAKQGKMTQSTPGGSYKQDADEKRFGIKPAKRKFRPRMPQGPAFNQKNVQNV